MDEEGHIFPSSNLYGCPIYLAPELPLALAKQAGNSHKRKKVDGRKCDYWSLGVCGLEMRSGKVSFKLHHVSPPLGYWPNTLQGDHSER